jgi:hypothetical protein
VRKEYRHTSKPLTLAIGVDSFLVPGDASPKVFLQIWDTSEEAQPCNEGEGGFNNILVDETDIDPDRVAKVIKEHGFSVPPVELFEVFD